jgi:hypothetical protein
MIQATIEGQYILPELELFLAPGEGTNDDGSITRSPWSVESALHMYDIWTREPGSRSDLLIKTAEALGRTARPVDVYAAVKNMAPNQTISDKHGNFLAREALNIIQPLVCELPNPLYSPGKRT